MKKKDITILLVDDETDILEILRYNLSSVGYHITTATNGKDGIEKAKKKIPQLIILDVMMPEMDGIETCEEMRKIPEIRDSIIVFLTARAEDYSQMAGLEAGADDYITKPIKPRLLVSKVNALLRKFKENYITTEGFIHIGDLYINKQKYSIEKNGEVYMLPRKQFELLYLLASQPGHVFSREQIMEKIWGDDTNVGGRTVDVHIRKLREKIGDDSIQTIKGVGYKFIS